MKESGPVLVTGARSGIGRAVVEILAGGGHLVYATARTESALKDLERIPNVQPVRLDVTKPADVKRAAEVVRRRGKGLYGLVNNAGAGGWWLVAELSVDGMMEILDVNLLGPHRLTRAMLPFLVESKGRIVNVSSINGLSAEGSLSPYCISKHALETYSETLANCLRPYGVHVSVVEPGTYRSPLMRATLARTKKWERTETSVVLKRGTQKLLAWADSAVEKATREPRPKAIPEAIVDALLSKNPRFRYCPCAMKSEFVWALRGPITRTVQANQGGGKYALTRKEMHELLDKVWDKEERKSR